MKSLTANQESKTTKKNEFICCSCQEEITGAYKDESNKKMCYECFTWLY